MSSSWSRTSGQEPGPVTEGLPAGDKTTTGFSREEGRGERGDRGYLQILQPVSSADMWSDREC